MKFSQSLFVSFALLGATALQAQSICAPTLPADICRLEEKIYTETNFKNTDDVRGVMVGLKQLFMAHVGEAELVQNHLIDLLEHVLAEAHEVRAPKDILARAAGQPNLVSIYDKLTKYQDRHGPIVPLDWALPTEIEYFVLNTTRAFSPVKDKADFDFGIFTILKTEDVIEQIQVIRYPNEVILDRQAGIGSWKNGHFGTGEPFSEFGSYEHGTAPKEGLYLLNVKVKNKPMVNGWFVLSRTTPSANPVIHSPRVNEVLTTGHPTLRWVDFQSPEFKPFNQQKRMLGIYARPGSDERVWSSSAVYPCHGESTTLAGAPNADGATELKNGDYAFKARFEERWFFGSLLIGRDSLIEVPFSVAK